MISGLDGKRIRRPSEYDELLEKMVRQDKVFSTLKNALVFAASVGYKKQLRLSFDKSSEPIKLPVFDREQDIPFMYSLALAETNNINMMKESHFDQVINIFEEYANGGLSFIESIYDSVASVQSIEQLVVDNNVGDDVTGIFEDW